MELQSVNQKKKRKPGQQSRFNDLIQPQNEIYTRIVVKQNRMAFSIVKYFLEPVNSTQTKHLDWFEI